MAKEATTSRFGGIKFPTTKDERVKLYGRNKELKRLRKCYSDLIQSSPPNNKAAVFVSGVHGVGKTALIDEFLFQPFDRRSGRQRKGGAGARNNNSSSQQHSVIRCNFPEEQDGYQSWEEIYSNLREMAFKQEARVVANASREDNNADDDDAFNEFLRIEDMCIEPSASGGQSTAAPPKIEDVQNSTSKESIHALLSIICSTTQQGPLIFFLDDCQNMNATSLEVLSYLLFEDLSLLGGLFIICAYSSTSNASSKDATAPFNEFLDRSRNRLNHQILDASMVSLGAGVDKTVEAIHVYPLALEVVTAFVADCSNKRDQIEVTSLAEVIYDKTIGIISYVRSAMNQLVAKNLLQIILCSDGVTDQFSWINDPTFFGGALPNFLLGECIVNDVIQSILTQVKEQLSLEVQRILTMMACMPNKVFHSSMLCELLFLEESDVRDLLQHASSLLCISSSATLTVSFSHDLIRQALLSLVSEEEKNDLVVRVFNSHFRKWREKRMHVREGNKAPKLRREMAALVAFFNVIDPSSLLTGDANNVGNLADSNISRNSNVSAVSDASSGSWEPRTILPVSKSVGHDLNNGRRRVGVRRDVSMHAKSLSFGTLKPSEIQNVARSLDAHVTRGNAEFSELTSSNDVPTNPFAKLISSRTSNGSSVDSLKMLIKGKTDQDPMTPQLAPARRQKQALESIFFPFVSDPKSVLIHHGSVCLHSRGSPSFATDNKPCCELENERELMIFSQGFIVADFSVGDSYHLMMALTDGDAITQESMMEYLRVKLAMDQEDDVSTREFVSTVLLRDVLHEISWPKYENFIRNLDPEIKGHVNRAELHRALENMFSLPLSPSSSKERSAQFASLFSSVSRVDCLDISHSKDARSKAISHSSLAERSFSITLKDQDGDLIFTCLDQNQRDSFVSALRGGVVNAIEKSTSPEATVMRKNSGWQYLVVRNSPICYIILNDAETLERIVDDSRRDGDDTFGEIRFKLSQLDENGYAAIHYASLLGRAQCVEILLEKGIANGGDLDVRGLSPLDLTNNDDVIEILEKDRGKGRKLPPRRMSLTKKRPGLSRGGQSQSSFRRLRDIPKPKRSVTFALKDESSRSLELFTSDSDSGEEDEGEPYVASMPNLRLRR
mmetsp:Transcript_26727/g.44152  ORF Transcript_26727/g.44152 Transcript_26727/m.44152 type:complete len:1126 (+) Transcript_26727:191-3568(+)